jgi:hypothetical protein
MSPQKPLRKLHCHTELGKPPPGAHLVPGCCLFLTPSSPQKGYSARTLGSRCGLMDPFCLGVADPMLRSTGAEPVVEGIRDMNIS